MSRSSVTLAALLASLCACASRSASDTYSHRFDDCLHRIEREQPQSSTAERNKICTTEVGPAPFNGPVGLVPAPVR